MAEKIYVRESVLRIMRSNPLPISLRKLMHALPPSYRSQADDCISLMLSQNILIRLGLGKRGIPYQLTFHPDAVTHKCPCCNRSIYGNETLDI